MSLTWSKPAGIIMLICFILFYIFYLVSNTPNLLVFFTFPVVISKQQEQIELFEKKIKTLETQLKAMKETTRRLWVVALYMRKEIRKLNKTRKVIRKTTVTAYSSSEDETDSTPNITAFMTPTRPGTIAVSRDLLRNGWTPGRKVWVEGLGVHTIVYAISENKIVTAQGGVFVINDIMNECWTNRFDIWFPTKQEALNFGVKEKTVVLILDEKT